MKNWKAIAGVCLVFILGVAAGGMADRLLIVHRIQRIVLGGPQVVNEVFVKHLTKRLGLDSSQSDQLMDIVVDTRKQIRAARVQIAPQMKDIMTDSEKKFRDILKPEQQKKFDELLENNKERLDRFEGIGT